MILIYKITAHTTEQTMLILVEIDITPIPREPNVQNMPLDDRREELNQNLAPNLNRQPVQNPVVPNVGSQPNNV